MKVRENMGIVLKTSIFSAIFTVVLFMLMNYFFSHNWNPFVSGHSNNPPITVQGTGTVSATPDQSDITFTVTKTEKTLQEAQNQANTFTNKIVSDLQKVGIAKQDIQTDNYNSYPNYNDQTAQPGFAIPVQPNQSQTIVSYTVSENVDITLHSTDKASQVIDAITKDGAENISGPNLSFSDAKQQDLENQARIKAIENAQAKAQSMADAAGIHLGKLVKIQEGDQNSVPIVHPLMMNAAVGTAKEVPTQINSGQNTVSTDVTLSYQTY